MQELPLNGFYEDESEKNSARRCVNLYPVESPAGAVGGYSLYSSYGITGEIESSGFSLSAPEIDEKIYSQALSDGMYISTTKGPFVFFTSTTSGANIVSIPGVDFLTNPGFKSDYSRSASFLNTVVTVVPRYANIVAHGASGGDVGNIIYKTNLNSAVDVPKVGSIPELVDVTYAGGRFLYACLPFTAATSIPTVYYSDIGLESPDSTNFISPDGNHSIITGVEELNGRVIVFTDKRIYPYSITSSTTTPFSANPASNIDVGMLGPSAKCKSGNTIYFIGSESGSYGLYAMSGGVTKLSSPAIDLIFTRAVAINNALSRLCTRLYQYREGGRSFIVCEFRGENSDGSDWLTMLYDISSGRWHERSISETDKRWSVSYQAGSIEGYATLQKMSQATIGSVYIINGDSSSTVGFRIGNPDSTLGTEWGAKVVREVVTSHFFNDMTTVKVSEIEPVIDVSSADISISVSRDYGDTYGVVKTRSITDNFKRLRFSPFGVFRQAFTVKISVDSLSPVRIIKLLTRISTGARQS